MTDIMWDGSNVYHKNLSLVHNIFVLPHSSMEWKFVLYWFIIPARVILDLWRTFQIVQHQERHFHPALSGSAVMCNYGWRKCKFLPWKQWLSSNKGQVLVNALGFTLLKAKRSRFMLQRRGLQHLVLSIGCRMDFEKSKNECKLCQLWRNGV